MRRFIVPLAALALVAAAMAFRPAPEATLDSSSVSGVWKAVQVHAELADTTFTDDVTNPSLLILTDGYWASMRTTGEGPRTDLPKDPTDEQRLEAWRRFAASAGSYTVSGSSITTTTLISKYPNAMSGKNTSTNEFWLDGEELVRVFKNSNGNTWTVTFERLE